MSAQAAGRSGIGARSFLGLAVEVFPQPHDLHVGHVWAAYSQSVEGSPEPAEHLMELLGRYLDFGGALAFLAREEPVAPTLNR